MRILLAEDDAEIAHLVRLMLREQSYEVDWVGDGEQALLRAQSIAYDLLVIDWTLPKRDGLAVVRNVRTAGIPTPVLMITGRTAPVDRATCLAMGADDFLVKPFGFDELLTHVRALVRPAALAETHPTAG